MRSSPSRTTMLRMTRTFPPRYPTARTWPGLPPVTPTRSSESPPRRRLSSRRSREMVAELSRIQRCWPLLMTWFSCAPMSSTCRSGGRLAWITRPTPCMRPCTRSSRKWASPSTQLRVTPSRPGTATPPGATSPTPRTPTHPSLPNPPRTPPWLLSHPSTTG